MIHIDVMDGHFVPPITIGPLVVEAIADQVHEAGGVLDVHLMIESPERQIADFAKAGADSITFHIEATAHAHRALGAVREVGCLAGVAINPATPPESVAEIAPESDLILAMTVNPGWGGQSFIAASPDKVRRLRAIVGAATVDTAPPIEVDGGIDAETAPSIVESGAELLVAGSAIFGASDPGEAYRRIAKAAGAV